MGAIKEGEVEYKEGETALVGFLAYDDGSEKPRPGVLVVQDWTGVGDYVIRGVSGEIYPCKPDIFEATYDPVS